MIVKVGIGSWLGWARGVDSGGMDIARVVQRSLAHQADATATARGSARHLVLRRRAHVSHASAVVGR